MMTTRIFCAQMFSMHTVLTDPISTTTTSKGA